MKIWQKEELLSGLEKNLDACVRGIVHLFELQTSDEQQTRDTKWDNAVGFSKRTVTRGQKLALLALSGAQLTETDKATALDICKIHWRQLLELANQKEQEKALKAQEAVFEQWMKL